MNTKNKDRHKRQPPLIFAGFLLRRGLDRVSRFAAPRTAHADACRNGIVLLRFYERFCPAATQIRGYQVRS